MLAATLAPHVLHVFGLRSANEVFNATAFWVVASVHNDVPFGDRANECFVNDAVAQHAATVASSDSCHAVPVRVGVSGVLKAVASGNQSGSDQRSKGVSIRECAMPEKVVPQHEASDVTALGRRQLSAPTRARLRREPYPAIVTVDKRLRFALHPSAAGVVLGRNVRLDSASAFAGHIESIPRRPPIAGRRD